MKAVGYRQSLPIDNPDALLDIELPDPVAAGRDLLVEIKAIAVNPVDTKVRRNTAPEAGQTKVLGYDATGIVKAIGPQVNLFKPGDRVWYAGSIARPGTNSQLHLVDERIVGRAPKSLGFAEAAALPLTTITAWELLFDRFGISPEKKRSDDALLIIGAAGGVGSIMTQLADRLTGLTIIGTASRLGTQTWVRELGADHVIDHSKPIAEELRRIGIPQVRYVASLTHTETHYAQIVEALKPQGKFGVIDDMKVLDAMPLKRKSISLHWELMFTRPLFETEDMIAQHLLLNRAADLIDTGVLRTTLGENFGTINANNLKRAHALLESGKAKGKIVLEGW
jgi:zinc-binding alcohol dehydrogenase family protein